MKSILAIAVFVGLVAVAASQVINGKVCFPEVFTVDQVSFLPQRDDVFMARVWFDFPNQRERVDIDVEIINGKHTHGQESFIMLYQKQKFYHIHYNTQNNSANCTVHNLNVPKLDRLCLARNAHMRDRILLGGVLYANNWVETIHDHNGNPVHVDILVAENIEVPIRSFARHMNRTSIDEFWNLEERVHHDAFVVPSFCRGQTIQARDKPIFMGIDKDY